MARRGGRWSTSRTSAGPSSPSSRHLASWCTTRPSTSAGPRTTYRYATSPSWCARRVPASTVTLADGAGPDLRNYRVDFAKLAETFPQLRLQWTIRAGVDELVTAYADHGLTYDEFTSSRFIRLGRIRELVAAGLVDNGLRRLADESFPASARVVEGIH